MPLPEYQRVLRARLQRAAEAIREAPGSRHALEAAAQAILPFKPDLFPADFRTQWEEIIAGVTRNHTVSIPVGVQLLDEAAVARLGEEVIALYQDVCEV